MPDAPDDLRTVHYFLDETGQPEWSSAKGQSLVGTKGNSRFFILGKLNVEDADGLTTRLRDLRQKLVADPYFKGVESFRPERRKTAEKFHATDDLPEVRHEVLRLLRAEGQRLSFLAVVRDKQALLETETAKRQVKPGYRYDPNGLYDELVRELFSQPDQMADHLDLCFAQRGKSDRTAAFQAALAKADDDCEQRLGARPRTTTSVRFSTPEKEGGLQAVDCFLWALQRFYEVRQVTRPNGRVDKVRESRFIEMLWPQVQKIYDIDLATDKRFRGTYFYKETPLTTNTRPFTK